MTLLHCSNSLSFRSEGKTQIKMAQNQQVLKIYGSEISLNCEVQHFAKLTDWLQDDFMSCPEVGPLKNRNLTINIVNNSPALKGLPWFWRRKTWVFGWGRQKCYRTADGICMNIEFASDRRVEIKGPGAEIIYETLYLLILSTLGEWFESKGWIRLHALSLETESGPMAFIAPQGFGKSLLSGLLLRGNSKLRLLGDEIAFVKGHHFLAFPLRLALDSSIAIKFQIACSGRQTYRDGKAHKAILADRPVKAKTLLPPQIFFIRSIDKKWKIVPGLSIISGFEIISGRGLPQMLQYIYRLDGLANLIQTLIHRWRWIQEAKKNRILQDLQAGPRTQESLEEFCNEVRKI